MDRRAFDYRVPKNDIVVYKWKDNKPVHIISNFHGAVAVSDCNMHVGGVDKTDMLCSLYGTSRKSKKWWYHILFGLVDRSLCNAYVVYNKLEMKNCNSLSFRRSVAQSLITLGKPPQVDRPISKSCNRSNS